MMIYSVFSFVVSRLPFVATVLTLVGFAASADFQPESALASLGESADLGTGVVYLQDDNNGNHNDNRNNDENRNHDNDNANTDENNNDENRNHDDNGNRENGNGEQREADTGPQ